MSLATRLSAFFLVALALVLAGFSGTLYVLARTYLVGQLDERLQHALDTLEASVDIEPGGLEWEPADRQMTLGVEHADQRRALGGPRRPWRAGGPFGECKPRELSLRLGAGGLAHEPHGRDGLRRGTRLATRGATAATRRSAAARPRAPGRRARLRGAVPGPGPGRRPGTGPRGGDAGLARVDPVGAVGRCLDGVGRGRSVAVPPRLAPVSRMARAATAMTAADLGQRLPTPGTGDELDELGRAFNDLLDRLHETFVRLHEAFDGQRRFAGDASHQLRTPLAALLGQVQVALRRDRSPEEYRRVLDRVQREGIRLRQIVESLLLLAQPEGVRPEPEMLDLGSWVPDHVRRWATHPRAADLRAEVADGRPLTVRAHPPLLAQLVDNLLENACKYSARRHSGRRPSVAREWVGGPGRRRSRLRSGGRGSVPRLRAILSRRAGAS